MSTPSMSSRLVYYVLLDSATGEPYKNTSEDFITLSSGSLVGHFRDTVLLKNPKKLSSVDASDLIVYKNKRSFENRNAAVGDENEKPLKASFPLDGLGETDEDDKILVVVVPQLTQNDLGSTSGAGIQQGISTRRQLISFLSLSLFSCIVKTHLSTFCGRKTLLFQYLRFCVLFFETIKFFIMND